MLAASTRFWWRLWVGRRLVGVWWSRLLAYDPRIMRTSKSSSASVGLPALSARVWPLCSFVSVSSLHTGTHQHGTEPPATHNPRSGILASHTQGLSNLAPRSLRCCVESVINRPVAFAENSRKTWLICTKINFYSCLHHLYKQTVRFGNRKAHSQHRVRNDVFQSTDLTGFKPRRRHKPPTPDNELHAVNPAIYLLYRVHFWFLLRSLVSIYTSLRLS